MPLFDLSGRVALVSGAASGMGRAMATALAQAGSDVMLAGRNLAGVEKTAGEIQKLGRRAIAVQCDVSQPEQIRAMFAQLDRDFGRIDFLGNVAGDAVLGAPEDIALEAVERTWRNLVYGRFCCCQEAGRRMLAAGRGSIVNIGSIASVTITAAEGIGYRTESLMSATKTLTPLRDTPQSISVMTNERLKDQSMASIGDVVKARVADMELETSLLRDLYIARG